MGTFERTSPRPEAAMALLARLRPRRGLPGVKAPVLLSLLLPTGAHAQIADVARPNLRGDFASIRVAGPRGSLAQRFWLVVDRDPRGLLCRDGQGQAWIALRYGAVVELDQPERQREPLLIQGQPTLRLAVRPIAILEDARSGERGKPAVCRVRANSAYLAPIQPDSLEQARLTP